MLDQYLAYYYTKRYTITLLYILRRMQHLNT